MDVHLANLLLHMRKLFLSSREKIKNIFLVMGWRRLVVRLGCPGGGHVLQVGKDAVVVGAQGIDLLLLPGEDVAQLLEQAFLVGKPRFQFGDARFHVHMLWPNAAHIHGPSVRFVVRVNPP